MEKRLFAKHIRQFVVALLVSMGVAGAASVSAQSTPAVHEDWRSVDYGFSSRMMITDANEDIYVLGDTYVGDYLVIKKFSAAGTLLWQTTYNPSERLRGVWMTVDARRVL